MNYSSLDEAFPFSAVAPDNGKRKKRRKEEPFQSGGGGKPTPPPQPSLPEPEVIEPDRPAHRRLPPAELLGGGPTENRESTSFSNFLNAFDPESYYPHPNSDVKDESVYRLEPDWTKSFMASDTPSWIKDRMASRDAEVPLTPAPWLDGAPTLWQKIPNALRGDAVVNEAEQKANSQLEEMQRKLDSMFKRLDDLDQTRAESNHLEIILFILGGVFILFMLDVLVKQGMQATAMIAAAGGSMLYKRNMSW